MGKLDGKVAAITGGSSGIGRATAIALATEGASIAICGRNETALEEVAQKVARPGADVIAKPVDLRKEQDIIEFIDTAVSKLGRVDILVNNAGVGYQNSISDGTVEEWRDMLETNVLGLLIGSREAIRVMKQNTPPGGDIVNISSNATKHDIGSTGQVYAATKYAVNAIGDGLRAELKGSGVRVTTVLPAMTLTNFARTWPQEMLDVAARFVGLDPEKEGVRRGEYLPQEGVDRTLKEHPGLLLSPDDLANAVVYAVTQPAHVHVDEVLVRPSIGVNIGG